MQKVIAIDFDDVCNDLLLTWVSWLNHQHGLNKTIQEMTNWDMTRNFPELSTYDVYRPLDIAEFWDKVYVYPEAKKAIQEMKQQGFQVVMVTTTSYDHAATKFHHCLFKYLGGIVEPEDIIITSRKDLIKCDYLIDDYPLNLKNSTAFRFLIDATHNKEANPKWYDMRTASLWNAWEYIQLLEKTY